MQDLSFMEKKFSLDELISHYLEDIKALRTPGLLPIDESKLQQYFQSASTFKQISTKDIVNFALSYGRSAQGKSAQMREAFSYILGNRITQPTAMDVAYLQVLLAYVLKFRDCRQNLKDWLLRFVISSQFSPLTSLVNREINYVIANTQQKIQLYKANVK